MSLTINHRNILQKLTGADVYLHPALTASMAENIKDVHDMEIEMTQAMNLRLVKVEEARRRHGKPFAHESGNVWRPRETPVLTEWMANRKHTTGPEAA